MTEIVNIRDEYYQMQRDLKKVNFPEAPKGIQVKLQIEKIITPPMGGLYPVSIMVRNDGCSIVGVNIGEFPMCCGVAIIFGLCNYNNYGYGSRNSNFKEGKAYLEPLVISIVKQFGYSSIIGIKSDQENGQWNKIFPNLKKTAAKFTNKRNSHDLQYYYLDLTKHFL